MKRFTMTIKDNEDGKEYSLFYDLIDTDTEWYKKQEIEVFRCYRESVTGFINPLLRQAVDTIKRWGAGFSFELCWTSEGAFLWNRSKNMFVCLKNTKWDLTSIFWDSHGFSCREDVLTAMKALNIECKNLDKDWPITKKE